MKKKIGEIYNIPVVIGNKNEVTKNEIHIDDLINILQSGGNTMIQFVVDGKSYQAEEGMTWQDFVDSKYNDGKFSIDTYVVYDRRQVADQINVRVAPSDAIVGNYDYIIYAK